MSRHLGQFLILYSQQLQILLPQHTNSCTTFY